MFRLGLIINPVAGLGGRVGLKGSDGEAIQQLARQRGAVALATRRMEQALLALLDYRHQLCIYTAGGAMGEDLCQAMGFDHQVLYRPADLQTSGDDTEQALQYCMDQGIDLLVFAGGDGTARNIYTAMQRQQNHPLVPVLGVPAGCKIHSSVYAVTPSHAGELLKLILRGRALSLSEASVMDIDEDAFRHNQLKAHLHGYLMVPAENRFMQSMKQGGIAHQELVLQEIAAYMVETMEDNCLYLIGSGSTTRAIMDELQLPSTLLGIDAVLDGELLLADVTEEQIVQLLQQYPRARLILTIIGGQGHVFGRGNQQISPRVIRRLGMENIDIIATPEKIHSLNGMPMRVDTGDAELDRSLYGMVGVITGYDEKLLYRMG